MITIVVAMASNGVIGKNGALPWHLPDDLKHFKAITLGKPVIMGRRTWAEVGRPLPGRRNIVITRQDDLDTPGAETASTLAEGLDLVATEPEIMIIGGGQIYRDALPKTGQIWRTLVHCEIDGDTHFPKTEWDQWSVVEETHHPANDGHAYAMTFQRLIRDGKKEQPEDSR